MSSRSLGYPAVFNPAEEGGYNISFPDFPGCFTFGKDLHEAKEKAQEVLELWLEELAANDELIPNTHPDPLIHKVVVSTPSSQN